MTTTSMHPGRGCDDDISMMIMSNNSSDTTTPLNLPTPTDANMKERMDQIDGLKYFLATATEDWEEGAVIKRYRLPTGEDMSCVLWNDLFYITGTDIVRSLTFRFHAFGRPVTNAKKFEEGIFSDLRNLKPGTDARLEEPKSELLDMLYKNNCIRTQKKQKVFYWYSVPHDRLFLDAVERDLKREKMDLEPTTTAVAEPAASISLDSTQELFDQLRKNMSLSAAATAHALEDEAARCAIPQHATPMGYWDGWMRQPATTATNRSPAAHVPATSALRRSRVNSTPRASQQNQHRQHPAPSRHHYHHLSHAASHAPPSRPSRVSQRTVSATSPIPSSTSPRSPRSAGATTVTRPKTSSTAGTASKPLSPMARAPGRGDTRRTSDVGSSKTLDSNALKKKKAIFGTLSLFDGSPTYKQRRRRATSTSSASPAAPYAVVNRHNPVVETPPPAARRPQRVPTTPMATSATPAAASSYRPSRLAMTAASAGYTNARTPVTAATAASVPPSPSPTTTDFAVVAAAAAAEMVEPERTYTCTQCGLLFKHLQSLDIHLHAHEMACSETLIKDPKLFQDGSMSTTAQDASPGVHMLNHEDHLQPDNCVYDRVPSSTATNTSNSGWPQAVISAATTTPTTGGSLCSSSRCSTLSPMLDLDFGVQPIQTLNRSRTSSTSEDDSSSSSLPSSPSMHIGCPSHQFSMQPHQQYQMLTPPPPPPPPDVYGWMTMAEEDDHRYYSHPVTLFSPFKPELYQHQQQQQFLQPIQDNNAYFTTTPYPVQDTTLMSFGGGSDDELIYQLQDTATTSSMPYPPSSFATSIHDVAMTMM